MTMQSFFGVMFIFLVACTPSPPGRTDVVIWARQISNLENRLEKEINQSKPLADRITSRPPNQDDLDQLTHYNDAVSAIYNDMIAMRVPPEAKSVHEEYVQNLSAIADSVRNYLLAVRLNDLSYYDRSVTSAEEAHRNGIMANNDFAALLNRFSISCQEIDFCQ